MLIPLVNQKESHYRRTIYLVHLQLCIAVIGCIINSPLAHALPYCQMVVAAKPSVGNETCVRQRIELAIQRHQTVIFGVDLPKEIIPLRCPVCGESNATQEFAWKFIPRSLHEQIFIESENSFYDSHWVLNENLLQDLPAIDPNNPCVNRITNGLYIEIRDVSKQVGTYVCTYLGDKNHPSNYIWYHVDQIASHRANSRSITIKYSSGIPNRINSLAELKSIQAAVRKELINYRGWKDQVVGPFVMTSQLSEEEAFLDRCGPLTIRQERRCYIRLPAKIPKSFAKEQFALIYQPLRKAFDFLVSFRDPSSLARGRSEQAARRRAKQLGFDIHGNGSYVYIPCEYGLFRHLYQFTELFSQFPRNGFHVDVPYDVNCGQINPLDLYELARIRELGNVSILLSEIEDFRYIKIQRLVKQGEKQLSLRCSSSTFQRPLRCNGSSHDVLWRSGNNLVFNHKRSLEDNVYVTAGCELRFTEVHFYDLDVYYCFLRDPSNTHQVWSRRPRIAYRLQMIHSNLFWPRKHDILVGIILLIAWSVILSVAWLVLNLYDTTIRDGAFVEAAVKQTGGRLNRLKVLYSPFSDEDRKLFFRMMENELNVEKD